MSRKGYYIADPDNYIQKEILKHLSKNLEESVLIRVSYPMEKAISSKKGKITKVLNKSKPKLFRNYIQKSSVIFLDLLLNPDIEHDVGMVFEAIRSSKYLDEPVKIVVVTTMMTWRDTSPFLYYRENHKEAYQKYIRKYNMPDVFGIPNEEVDKKEHTEDLKEKINEEQEIGEKHEDIDKNTENGENEEMEIKIDMIRKKFLGVRSSHRDYEKIKQYEDKLLSLTTVHENIHVYMIYTGVLYGEEQLVLKPFFENAFKQKSLFISKEKFRQDFVIPLFDIKELAPTIMKIIHNDQFLEEDNKSNYGDQEEEKTQTIPEQVSNEDNIDEEETKELLDDESQIKELGKKVIVFLDEKTKYTHREIIEIIAQNFGNYKTIKSDQKHFDEVLMHNFNFEKNKLIEEIIGEDKKNFKSSIKNQIIRFLSINKLGPIKIFLTYFNSNNIKVAKALSLFYKIKIVDSSNFLERLIIHRGFEKYKFFFTAKENKLLELLMEKKINFFLLNPQKFKEEINFYLNLLKVRLSLNDCLYKGFIFLNQYSFANCIDYQDLFYVNKLSVKEFQKSLKQNWILNQKEQIEKLKLQKQQEILNIKLQNEKKAKMEKFDSQENSQDDVSETNKNEEIITEDKKEDTETNQDKSQFEEEEKTFEIGTKNDFDNSEENTEQEEEQSGKAKLRETFFPDHFLILIEKDDYNNLIDELIDFCISKNLCYFLKLVDIANQISFKDHINELQSSFRIYIERVT